MEEPVIINGRVYSSSAEYTKQAEEQRQKEKLDHLKTLDAKLDRVTSLMKETNDIVTEATMVIDHVDKSVTSSTNSIDTGAKKINKSPTIWKVLKLIYQ